MVGGSKREEGRKEQEGGWERQRPSAGCARIRRAWPLSPPSCAPPLLPQPPARSGCRTALNTRLSRCNGVAMRREGVKGGKDGMRKDERESAYVLAMASRHSTGRVSVEAADCVGMAGAFAMYVIARFFVPPPSVCHSRKNQRTEGSRECSDSQESLEDLAKGRHGSGQGAYSGGELALNSKRGRP